MKETKDLLDQFFQQNQALTQLLKSDKEDIYQLWPGVLQNLGMELLARNSCISDWEGCHLRVLARHSVFIQELKMRQNIWLPALEQALQKAGASRYRIEKVSFRSR